MSNTVILGITSLFLALMWYLEIRSTNALKKQLREEREKKFNEQVKTYERHFKFINIENAGDNDTLNRLVKQMEDDGYKYSYEDTLDNGILAFVKLVEVKSGFKD